MLKVATEAEERRGAETMIWWAGGGAAACLPTPAMHCSWSVPTGEGSLVEMVRKTIAMTRQAASSAPLRARLLRSAMHPPHPVARAFDAVVCRARTRRHSARGPPPSLASATAHDLLDDPRDAVVLHGDIHHGDILDFGCPQRVELAIDPKHLVGRTTTFDFVNILRNPDDRGTLAPGRFPRQATVVADAGGLDRTRPFFKWTLAFTGLSAASILGDGDEPGPDFAVAELAAAELSWG